MFRRRVVQMSQGNSMVLHGLRPARLFGTKEEAVDRVRLFERGWDTSVAAQVAGDLMTLTVRFNGTRVAGFQRGADEAAAETLRRVGKKLEAALLPPAPKKKKEKGGEISREAPPPRLVLTLRDAGGAVVADSRAEGGEPTNTQTWDTANALVAVPSPAALAEESAGKPGVTPDAEWTLPVVCNPPEVTECVVEPEPLANVTQLAQCASTAGEPDVLWFGVPAQVFVDGVDEKRKKRGLPFLPTLSNTLEHPLTTYLHCGPTYTPSADDVGKTLCLVFLPAKPLPAAAAEPAVVKGVPVYHLTPRPVAPFGEFPGFQKYPSAAQNAAKGASSGVRVLTYNILHDGATEIFGTGKPMYPYADERFVKLSYRKQALLHEIAHFAPDILCLQEVGTSLHDKFLTPYLAALGYAPGHYAQKLGDMREGVSIFWKANRFAAVDAASISLGGPDVLEQPQSENPALAEISAYLDEAPKAAAVLKKTTTVGQVLVLEEAPAASGAKPKRWVVGNTHLWFHPKGSHIRVLQAHMLCKLIEQQKRVFGADVAVACGDLNCLPGSAPHKYLMEGRLPADHAAWSAGAVFDFCRWDFAEGAVDAEESSDGLAQVPGVPLAHSLAFADATPDFAYSNFTPGFTGRLDYIMHGPALKVSYVHPMPPPEVLAKEGGGIPASMFPSDHLPVCADFQYA